MQVLDEDDIILNGLKHNAPNHVLNFDPWEVQSAACFRVCYAFDSTFVFFKHEIKTETSTIWQRLEIPLFMPDITQMKQVEIWYKHENFHTLHISGSGDIMYEVCAGRWMTIDVCCVVCVWGFH